MGAASRVVAVAWVAISAGCASGPLEPAGAPAAVYPSDPVVIALLDSGVVPYVEIMQVADDTVVASSVGIPFERVVLSAGDDVRELRDRDRAIWESLEVGHLYHFAGTRLLAIGFDPQSPTPITQDNAAHGVATSYLAARDAPGAVIVMVQVSGGRECVREGKCLGIASQAAGMEWIAQQDWIDIVSISMGPPANHPEATALDADTKRYLQASEAAVRSGKLVVNGAGNTIVPPLFGKENGPPWIVTVGGYEINASGESLLASKLVDVVANFTDYAPADTLARMDTVGGTSVSTPIVAGTIAEALRLVRAADPGRYVGPQELREALNASALVAPPGEWRPLPPPGQGLPADPNQASLPVLVQPQVGWGYVDASLAPEIARRILEEDYAVPAEKDQASLFQPAWQRAREEFWARYK